MKEKEIKEKIEDWRVLEKILEDCSDNVIEGVKEYIRQEKQKSYKDGKLNGWLEAMSEIKQRITKVGGK